MPHRPKNKRRLRAAVIPTAVVSCALMVTPGLTAFAAESMTITFIRHGESEGNASGAIDTSIPGPGLTPLGHEQSQIVAAALSDQHSVRPYDGIYASAMIRTQQTAGPTAERLDTDVVILNGIHELPAGIFEGQPASTITELAAGLPGLLWTTGLRSVPILGSTENGYTFDARVDESIGQIYDTGDRNVVVFSHGGTISVWTMMNVDNPDPLLMLTHRLDNTSAVKVEGNPEDGWTLVEWDGVQVAREPSLPIKVFVAVRDGLAKLTSRPASSTPAAVASSPAEIRQESHSPAPQVAALATGKDDSGNGSTSTDDADEASRHEVEVARSTATRNEFRTKRSAGAPGSRPGSRFTVGDDLRSRRGVHITDGLRALRMRPTDERDFDPEPRAQRPIKAGQNNDADAKSPDQPRQRTHRSRAS